MTTPHGEERARKIQRIQSDIDKLSRELQELQEQEPCSPQEYDEKTEEAKLREIALRDKYKAGEYTLTFGKHKNSRLDQIPLLYAVWLAGFRRHKREFTRITDTEPHLFVSQSHPMAMANANIYLKCTCWACGSTSVKFLNSRLCTQCWFDNE